MDKLTIKCQLVHVITFFTIRKYGRANHVSPFTRFGTLFSTAQKSQKNARNCLQTPAVLCRAGQTGERRLENVTGKRVVADACGKNFLGPGFCTVKGMVFVVAALFAGKSRNLFNGCRQHLFKSVL